MDASAADHGETFDRPVTEHRLTVVADELQAEMVRAVLESGGIASVVRKAALGEVQWGAINTGMGGPREIVVDAADADAARALLDETGADQPADDVAHDLVRRDTHLRLLFGFVVLVLFGGPLIYGLTVAIINASGAG